ncbi:MAG: acetyl-CoA carboxylase biotin carboxylase subunit, partial [Chloroflexi bacterium]
WMAPAGPGVRVDSGYGPATEVPANYDSLVAKLIVYGADRAEAIGRAQRALAEFVLAGPATTIPYHRAILASPDFKAGKLSTGFIAEHPELLEDMRKYLDEVSPMDYSAVDSRRLAAAAAAVSTVMSQGQGRA